MLFLECLEALVVADVERVHAEFLSFGGAYDSWAEYVASARVWQGVEYGEMTSVHLYEQGVLPGDIGDHARIYRRAAELWIRHAESLT